MTSDPASPEPQRNPRGALVVDGVVMTLQGRPVLAGADLVAPAGTAMCVAGKNGAGKTTLLRVIAGILEPSAGTVRFGDLSPLGQQREYLKRLGFVSAGNAGLEPRLTVAQNLMLAAALAFVAPGVKAAAVKQTMQDLEITGIAGRRVDRLSLGQRQRVRLGLGLVHRPTLLLLDEPDTSLDADGIAGVARAIRGVTDRGGVAIWAAPSPDNEAIPRDAVAVVSSGRVCIA